MGRMNFSSGINTNSTSINNFHSLFSEQKALCEAILTKGRGIKLSWVYIDFEVTKGEWGHFLCKRYLALVIRLFVYSFITLQVRFKQISK